MGVYCNVSAAPWSLRYKNLKRTMLWSRWRKSTFGFEDGRKNLVQKGRNGYKFILYTCIRTWRTPKAWSVRRFDSPRSGFPFGWFGSWVTVMRVCIEQKSTMIMMDIHDGYRPFHGLSSSYAPWLLTKSLVRWTSKEQRAAYAVTQESVDDTNANSKSQNYFCASDISVFWKHRKGIIGWAANVE